MDFKKLLTLYTLSIAFLATGCGGSDGGTSSPSLPANAVVITTANAVDIANMAIIFSETGSSLIGVEASSLPIQSTIDRVVERAFDRNREASSIVAGVTTSDLCGSGSTDFNGTITATSSSGTLTFNNCTDFGITINGVFTFTSTWDISTGAYNDSGSGTITTSVSGLSFSMTLSYSAQGNSFSGDFSSNISYSISSPFLEGFLVTTVQDLIGNLGVVTGGQLIVEGRNGTRLRITFNSNNTVTIDLDNGNGTFSFFIVI